MGDHIGGVPGHEQLPDLGDACVGSRVISYSTGPLMRLGRRMPWRLKPSVWPRTGTIRRWMLLGVEMVCSLPHDRFRYK